MSNIDEKEQTIEIPNRPTDGLSHEEFSKSILIDVGHNKIPNKLFKAFIDNKKYIYYASTFGIFAKPADKFALTWNLFAFFIPFCWLLYRKMYAYGIIAFILSIGLTGAGFFLSDINTVNNADTLSNTGIITEVLIGFIVNVIIGLVGNYLYFAHCKKILIHIMNTIPLGQQEDEAKKQGGTDARIVWIVSIICIAAYALFTFVMLG